MERDRHKVISIKALGMTAHGWLSRCLNKQLCAWPVVASTHNHLHRLKSCRADNDKSAGIPVKPD